MRKGEPSGLVRDACANIVKGNEARRANVAAADESAERENIPVQREASCAVLTRVTGITEQSRLGFIGGSSGVYRGSHLRVLL